MISEERNTENFAFCIDFNRPLGEGPVIRGSLEPLSVMKYEISFMDVGKDIRDELYNEMENFKATLQGIACQWRYLKLKEKLEVNQERIPEKELEAKYGKAYKRIIREMEELENQMEAAKPPQEKPASDEPDFVRKPDIKCKRDAEDFCTMSQEKFEEMIQHYLKSHPRCKFAEGNGSSSIEKDSASGCEENQRHPHTILADLPTKIVPILVGTATDILEVSTQSEYIKFAAMLLNEAARYNNIFSHAKGYDESVSNAVKALQNREAKSSREAAI